MHELSICRAIAATATDHAGGRSVASVRLRIGHFRQVVPETLAHCWELHTKGTDLDGCRLEVDYVPAVAHCRACGTDTRLDDPIVKCDNCDGNDAVLISGEEFLVQSIDVRDEVH
jgi:hydrogenase nickel incorporation protein HypA/HybF